MSKALFMAAAAAGAGGVQQLYDPTTLFEAILFADVGATANVFYATVSSPHAAFGFDRDQNTGNPTFYESNLYGSLLNTNTTNPGDVGGPWVPFLNLGSAHVQIGDAGTGARQVLYILKKAASFFDITLDTGTGVAKNINHSLGVVPELIIRKSVGNAAGDWSVRHADLAALNAGNYLQFHTNAAVAVTNGRFTTTAPTTTTFRVGANTETNTNLEEYITLLFATAAGVSKVGIYTGDGTVGKTIDCGFATGARFILIKRTDTTGDWYVWDYQRGIIAGNDPHLNFNSLSLEVTSNDSVDPTSIGFIVNQRAATNINVNGGTYIFLAIA